MRALQVIQTLMLIAIIIGIVESANTAANVEKTVNQMSGELKRLAQQQYELEHRVSYIEAHQQK